MSGDNIWRWPWFPLLVLASCAQPGSHNHGQRAGPLTPHSAAASQLDVRELDSRPKLAIIRRDGDPVAALVVAVAAAEGPRVHAALAGLLQSRLSAAGAAFVLQSDGLGLRAVATPSPKQLKSMLRAWVKATNDAVSASDLAAANARIERLREAPLPSPVLEPVARCAGDRAALARDLRPLVASRLEALRRSALVMERTAVAIVGPASVASAASDAMEHVDGWLRGRVAGPSEQQPGHGAFVSSGLEPMGARLHVGLHIGDAISAVGIAHRLRGSSPLSSKLDALPSPWVLRSVEAVALPHGGCVRMVLTPGNGGVVAQQLARSAARALATVRRESTLQAQIETDPFLVTREVIGAGDAREAAARAAWWALSVPGQKHTTISSALEWGAPGKTPPPNEGAPFDASAIATSYAKHAAERAITPAKIAGRRSRTERGQGQFWVMIASPCPLLHEGQWDAGLTAMSATTVAAQAHSSGVRMQPWVSADGVGVIAHAALRDAEESTTELTERVARSAARAYATVPHDAHAFRRAQRTALRHRGGDASAAFLLARRVLPDHPSWMSPWGNEARLAGTDLAGVAARWRDILHGPVRVAVLNNDDDAQTEVAAKLIDHWLLPEAVERPCAETTQPQQAQAGHHQLAGAAPTVMVGVPYVSASERPFAEITAAALSNEADELELIGYRWQVRVVGGRRGGALVLSTRVSGADVQKARTAIVARLQRLSSQGPDAAIASRARARLTERRNRDLHSPRTRLIAVWRDEARATMPETGRWKAWLKKRAAKDKLVVVTTQ